MTTISNAQYWTRLNNKLHPSLVRVWQATTLSYSGMSIHLQLWLKEEMSRGEVTLFVMWDSSTSLLYFDRHVSVFRVAYVLPFSVDTVEDYRSICWDVLEPVQDPFFCWNCYRKWRTTTCTCCFTWPGWQHVPPSTQRGQRLNTSMISV